MNNEEVITSILNTYDLPIKLKKKLEFISNERINKLHIGDYDKIYRYVDNLVNKFQAIYQERFFLRLDSPIGNDSKTLFHELIKMPNYLEEDNKVNEENYLETKKPEKISLNDLREIFRSQLDVKNFGLINQFFSNIREDVKLDISSDYIIKSIPKIQSRLEQLIRKNNGKFVIPKKPIIEIKLSPPLIKFGRRNYQRNPIKLFKEHPLQYGWIKKRTELYHFDCGMYASLIRWGQIILAIPEKIFPGSTTKILKEKEKEIINAFEIDKSPTKIAKKLNVSRATIDYYSSKHDLRKLRKKPGNPGYSKQKISQIIRCLKRCEIVSKVAKCNEVSRYTVARHGRNAKVPILQKGTSEKRLQAKYIKI